MLVLECPPFGSSIWDMTKPIIDINCESKHLLLLSWLPNFFCCDAIAINFLHRYDFLIHISWCRFVLFSGWEVVLRTCLDMRGLVYYLVNIDQVVVHVVLVTGMQA